MEKKGIVGLCFILLTLGISTASAQSGRKLGTHNSMTYMKPCGGAKTLAMWPFAKCQSMDYKEQYDFGVRFYDLRIRFIDGTPYFAHGEVEFCDVDAYTVLDYLNSKGDCAVNLVLENSSKIGTGQNDPFIALCKESLEKYKNIHFIGGWAKYPDDHPIVFQFDTPGVSRDEKYKVFTLLNEALDEVKSKKSSGLKKIGAGVTEFAQRPEGFAESNNPGYWSEWLADPAKENVILMLDFPEKGAPDEWGKAHSGSSNTNSDTTTKVNNLLKKLKK